MAGQMKGAGMREIVRWHERQVGRARMRELGAALPAELTASLDLEAEALGILTSAWYPSALPHALVAAFFGGLPDAKRAAAMREAAHAAIRATARGIYRLVLARLATPSMLAGSIQRLWSLMHDDGERHLALTGPSTMESRTRRWTGHGSEPYLCELMCETTAAILETMGKRDVRVKRVACVAHGDAECAVEYRWSE